LAQVDPEAAAKITPADEKRIIRALEVFELTGLPISHFHRLDRARAPRYNPIVVGLSLPRPVLYARIEARIDKMLQAGLLEEVERLKERGYHAGLVSMKALGYAQLLAHLAGEMNLEEAIARFKRDTRRFAKRQMTWFRAEPGVRWLEMENQSPAQIAKEVIDIFNRGD
jgi:tRNA dimethylallyltransferase